MTVNVRSSDLGEDMDIRASALNEEKDMDKLTAPLI